MSQLVYMDGLNFATCFFPRFNHGPGLKVAVGRIQEFIEAAAGSGYELVVFLDASQKSAEADQKWKLRRQRELMREEQFVPQGLPTLICNAFQSFGVKVAYPIGFDNDDALASHAQVDQAYILSGDQDFYRYRDSSFKVFSSFEIKDKKLHLQISEPNHARVAKTPKRDLIDPPILSDTVDLAAILCLTKTYRRGTGSPLNKLMGNPHLIVRQLRQALYHRLGITGVKEIFPTWNGAEVEWVDELIEADATLDALLDDPLKAVNRFFPDVEKWATTKRDQKLQTHAFCCYSITFELCILGRGTNKSLLELLMPLYANTPNPSIPSINDLSDAFTTRLQLNFAYTFQCFTCKKNSGLSQSDLDFYQSKGFSMPKYCKECKQAKKTKKW
jgi:hypothetical protein